MTNGGADIDEDGASNTDTDGNGISSENGENNQSESSPPNISIDSIREADLQSLKQSQVENESLEIVRKESREVLSERIDLIKDIDDKAMRTVRTSVLLIGLFISAIQVSDTSLSNISGETASFQIAAGGVTFLLMSIVLGVWTYSASEPDFGVSDDHRKDVIEGHYDQKEWLLFQLGEYSEWIGNMRSMTRKNVQGLHLTLFTATAGVFTLLLSVIYNVGWGFNAVATPAVIAIFIASLFAAILYLSRSDV